ncbi:MAG: hypothetical protein K2M82_07340 [Lachnospiraceae bacterium]|nr:hypothetical protein [Lachnospiraceae bacterium]
MSINLSLKELSLDLQSQGYTNTIVLPQGDSYSRKLVISLYDGGKKYAIPKSNYITVDLVGSRADGAIVNRHVDEYTDNVITLILRDEELAVKGTAKFKINIVSVESEKKVVLSSFPFKIKVSENVYNPDGLKAYPKIDAIEEVIKKASILTAQIAGIEQAAQGIENINVLANKTNTSFTVSVTDRDGNTITSDNLMDIGSGGSGSGGSITEQTTLTETLAAGETQLTFTSEEITEDAVVDFYAKDNLNVQVRGISYVDGSITITFEAMDNDIEIMVVIH